MPLKNSLPKLRQTLPIYQDQRVVIDRTIDSHIKNRENWRIYCQPRSGFIPFMRLAIDMIQRTELLIKVFTLFAH